MVDMVLWRGSAFGVRTLLPLRGAGARLGPAKPRLFVADERLESIRFPLRFWVS